MLFCRCQARTSLRGHVQPYKINNRANIAAIVDGSQPGVSDGMSLRSLAGLLLDSGASEAINLDGGGSITA